LKSRSQRIVHEAQPCRRLKVVSVSLSPLRRIGMLERGLLEVAGWATCQGD